MMNINEEKLASARHLSELYHTYLNEAEYSADGTTVKKNPTFRSFMGWLDARIKEADERNRG